MVQVVSIHPYFKVHPGKMDAVQALLRKFVEKTRTEYQCVCYEFTQNGDVIFCREAYEGAEGALAHIQNIGEELGEMLKLSDLLRLEIHGSAEELEKLKEPTKGLNVEWYVFQCGVPR